MNSAPPVTRMRTAGRSPRSAGTDGTNGSFTFGSSGRDQCCGGGASFPGRSRPASYGPTTQQPDEDLVRAAQPHVSIPVSRSDPREPEQPSLPPRLDPRAGRPRTSPSAGSGSRSGLGRLAAATRVVAALAAAAVLGTSGWGWYLGEVADSSVNRADALPADGNVDQFDGGAMNLLLVGSDSRARLSKELQEELTT